MDAPQTCPGCGTPVEPNWTICQKCLLPRHLVSGEQEITVVIRCTHCGGRIAPHEALCPSCRRPRPRIVLSPESVPKAAAPYRSGGTLTTLGTLLFGLGAIYLGYKLYSQPPAKPAPTQAAAQAQSDAAAKNAADNLLQAMPPSNHWTVKGHVYGLLTLTAIRGAALTFTDKSSRKSVQATTDEEGAYIAALPNDADQGYAVSVRYRNRACPFLEDMEPPYRSQDRDRRQQAVELIQDPSLLHVPILPGAEQTELVYDVVLHER